MASKLHSAGCWTLAESSKVGPQFLLTLWSHSHAVSIGSEAADIGGLLSEPLRNGFCAGPLGASVGQAYNIPQLYFKMMIEERRSADSAYSTRNWVSPQVGALIGYRAFSIRSATKRASNL